jgi:hypothetical protein
MINPQERQLLDRLLRRAHPTQLQRELIARLQAKAGLPIAPGPAEVRYQEILRRRREERERIIREIEEVTREAPRRRGVLGEARGGAGFRYHYTRIIEVIPRYGRGRLSRYNVIRVDSDVPLAGADLEEEFRLAIQDFRRLRRYVGPAWFVSPFLC